jgi:hypothetical protein
MSHSSPSIVPTISEAIAGPNDAMLEIIGHLGAALMQATPTDDAIIIGHIKSAHLLALELHRNARTNSNSPLTSKESIEHGAAR